MSKPTGRPNGRPRKVIGAPIVSPRTPVTRDTRDFAVVFGELTEAQIDALLPRDLFRLLVKVAIAAKDDKMLHVLVRDWAPYEHARKTEGPQLTAEEVRRLGEMARTEAIRRGVRLLRLFASLSKGTLGVAGGVGASHETKRPCIHYDTPSLVSRSLPPIS